MGYHKRAPPVAKELAEVCLHCEAPAIWAVKNWMCGAPDVSHGRFYAWPKRLRSRRSLNSRPQSCDM